MGFTTPCFIRKNTQELRRGLEELGYSHGKPKYYADDDNKYWRRYRSFGTIIKSKN